MKLFTKTFVAMGVLSAALVSGAAMADDCSVDITGNDAMKFSLAEIAVKKSCETFTINLEHVGKLPKNVMGHNVVVAKTDEVAAIATDAIKAGLAAEYLPKDDARVVAASGLVGGGEKTSVTFDVAKLAADQNYSFFCSFPGHSAVMKGAIKLVD